MFDSIIDDLKNVFRSGNMVSRIVTVNVIVFIVINLIVVFDFNKTVSSSSFSSILIQKLSMVAEPIPFLKQIWAIITHMFLHLGFWHLLWNMLYLYWFGRIVGDLIGDHYILPIYIMGGITGAIFFVAYCYGSGIESAAYAYGASAAAMAMVSASAWTSPNYSLNLIFIGSVPLKYVALAIILLDIFALGSNINTGGHWGHIGGALFGGVFVTLLRKGYDVTQPMQNLVERLSNINTPKRKKTPRSQFTVYKNKPTEKKKKSFDQQEELDRILDKINDQGYENLTKEEKEFLYQASKKK